MQITIITRSVIQIVTTSYISIGVIYIEIIGRNR